MSIISITIDGRLTKEPAQKSYGEGKSLTAFSVACSTGFGDNKKTLFFDCSAFGKTGDAIAKYCNKGDQIIVQGTISQNKKDDKVYWNIRVSEFSFGQRKGDGTKSTDDNETPNDNPFNDDDIQF